MRRALTLIAFLLSGGVALAQPSPWKQTVAVIEPSLGSTTIKAIKLPSLATGSLLTAGTASRIAYDSTVNAVKYDDGTEWRTLLDSADIGGGVQAYDGDLDDLADGSLTGSKVGTGIDAGNVSAGTLANARLDADLQTWADVTPAAGVATALATPSSANLRTAITDETGTGATVFATSPTLVTPMLGTPTSGTLTNCTGLPIDTGVSGLGAGVATALATPSSVNLRAAITDETGTGSAVFATSPTLVTPLLGTPTSGTLTSCTGLPIATGVSGLGANVATALASFTSANLAAATTNETGTGLLVFATSPTLTTPALGTPSSGVLSSCTGFPTETSGESALGANFSITAASGTYAATGLTVTLPSAGTYWVHWQARASLNSSATGTLLAGILKNTTDSANVTNSFAVLCSQQAASVSVAGSSGAGCVLTVAASKTLELYVQRNGSGFTTTDIVAAGIGGDKGTVISYVKIAH